MMPKGLTCDAVRIPMMPKGVEHQTRSPNVFNFDGENSDDAERR